MNISLSSIEITTDESGNVYYNGKRVKNYIKKSSIVIPDIRYLPKTSSNHHTDELVSPFLKLYLKVEHYHQLQLEIHGNGVDEVPSRPDIDIFRIGMNAKIPQTFETIDSSNQLIIHDKTQGKGLEVLYHISKSVYILSKDIEDQLILLAYNDLEKTLVLNESYIRFGTFCHSTINRSKIRMWRRFINSEIVPLLLNQERIKKLISRYQTHHMDDKTNES